jgi:MFS family permease
MPIPLWRNRDFLLLWTGQVVSTIGTRVSGLAYPLVVLAITGSAAQAGLVAAAQTAPFLIWFLPAGALVDRWPRKRIMLAADAGRAVALASVAVAVLLGRIMIGYLIVVAFAEGTLYVFFLLAETAALPYVVPKPQLPTAVAQNRGRTCIGTGTYVKPVLGGQGGC